MRIKQTMISIIMPVFNSGSYLEETIKSVLTQSYKDFQLIIIDDGSTDDSFNICKHFAENDNRILLLHQENHGVSVARNNGLKHIKGDILIFSDFRKWVTFLPEPVILYSKVDSQKL